LGNELASWLAIQLEKWLVNELVSWLATRLSW